MTVVLLSQMQPTGNVPPPPPPGGGTAVVALITDTGSAVYPWGTFTTNAVITDSDPTEIGRITDGPV